MDYLENIPFDELRVGDSTTMTRTVTERDIQLFAYLSGDINPLHLDEEYARSTPFSTRIAHGLFVGLLVTTAVATRMPGPGTIYRSQEMKFHRPVKIGDTVTAALTLIEKKKRGNLVKIEFEMTNQHGEVVFSGVSTAVAPSEKIRVKAAELPQVHFS